MECTRSRQKKKRTKAKCSRSMPHTCAATDKERSDRFVSQINFFYLKNKTCCCGCHFWLREIALRASSPFLTTFSLINGPIHHENLEKLINHFD